MLVLIRKSHTTLNFPLSRLRKGNSYQFNNYQFKVIYVAKGSITFGLPDTGESNFTANR